MTLKRVGGLTGLRLEISDPYYLYINMHIAYMVPYDGLWGHYSLQTASEVTYELIFEIHGLRLFVDGRSLSEDESASTGPAD